MRGRRFLHVIKAFQRYELRATAETFKPCNTAARGGRYTRTHAHMVEQPISLDGTDGVSSAGAPDAIADGGDPIAHILFPSKVWVCT